MSSYFISHNQDRAPAPPVDVPNILVVFKGAPLKKMCIRLEAGIDVVLKTLEASRPTGLEGVTRAALFQAGAKWLTVFERLVEPDETDPSHSERATFVGRVITESDMSRTGEHPPEQPNQFAIMRFLLGATNPAITEQLMRRFETDPIDTATTVISLIMVTSNGIWRDQLESGLAARLREYEPYADEAACTNRSPTVARLLTRFPPTPTGDGIASGDTIFDAFRSLYDDLVFSPSLLEAAIIDAGTRVVRSLQRLEGIRAELSLLRNLELNPFGMNPQQALRNVMNQLKSDPLLRRVFDPLLSREADPDCDIGSIVALAFDRAPSEEVRKAAIRYMQGFGAHPQGHHTLVSLSRDRTLPPELQKLFLLASSAEQDDPSCDHSAEDTPPRSTQISQLEPQSSVADPSAIAALVTAVTDAEADAGRSRPRSSDSPYYNRPRIYTAAGALVRLLDFCVVLKSGRLVRNTFRSATDAANRLAARSEIPAPPFLDAILDISRALGEYDKKASDTAAAGKESDGHGVRERFHKIYTLPHQLVDFVALVITQGRASNPDLRPRQGSWAAPPPQTTQPVQLWEVATNEFGREVPCGIDGISYAAKTILTLPVDDTRAILLAGLLKAIKSQDGDGAIDLLDESRRDMWGPHHLLLLLNEVADSSAQVDLVKVVLRVASRSANFDHQLRNPHELLAGLRQSIKSLDETGTPSTSAERQRCNTPLSSDALVRRLFERLRHGIEACRGTSGATLTSVPQDVSRYLEGFSYQDWVETLRYFDPARGPVPTDQAPRNYAAQRSELLKTIDEASIPQASTPHGLLLRVMRIQKLLEPLRVDAALQEMSRLITDSSGSVDQVRIDASQIYGDLLSKLSAALVSIRTGSESSRFDEFMSQSARLLSHMAGLTKGSGPFLNRPLGHDVNNITIFHPQPSHARPPKRLTGPAWMVRSLVEATALSDTGRNTAGAEASSAPLHKPSACLESARTELLTMALHRLIAESAERPAVARSLVHSVPLLLPSDGIRFCKYLFKAASPQQKAPIVDFIFALMKESDGYAACVLQEIDPIRDDRNEQQHHHSHEPDNTENLVFDLAIAALGEISNRNRSPSPMYTDQATLVLARAVELPALKELLQEAATEANISLSDLLASAKSAEVPTDAQRLMEILGPPRNEADLNQLPEWYLRAEKRPAGT